MRRCAIMRTPTRSRLQRLQCNCFASSWRQMGIWSGGTMKNSSGLIRSWIAGVLVMLLCVPFQQVAAASPQQELPASAPQVVPPQQQSVPSQDRPQDSNGGTGKKAPDAAGATNSGNTGGVPAQSTSQEQQPTEPAKPVGTAAAPYEKTMGVAASRPAGAVIAPAKQRRVRTILIRMGVIVGAGVAIGTVAALSHGSPSRPH